MKKLTMFDQIMKLMDEKEFLETVSEAKSDKWSKIFKTKDHLAVMIFAQLMNCKSLRELEIQFNTMQNKNYVEIKRSTLSDANSFRASSVFESLCLSLIDRQNNDLNELLRILDSTSITISGRGSEWALERATRNTKGIKVHIQLVPQSLIINHIVITPPNVNDITAAKSWDIVPRTINIFDKGYFDFNWWYKIHAAGAYFVTRLKKNTNYRVIQEIRRAEGTPDTVLHDQLIRLTNKHPRGGKVNLLANTTLRLVIYQDPVHQKTYTFITNLITASPQEIAAYYKIRWEIELFFKWLKQNLKIKHFLGTTENSVKIQIYVAIITYMLLRELAKIMKLNFIRMKDLLAWIKMVVCHPIKNLFFTANNIHHIPYFYVKKGFSL